MLLRVVKAFGKERVMWGSDATQTTGHHSWAESLYYIRDTEQLSQDEKAWVLGGSLRKTLNWPVLEDTTVSPMLDSGSNKG